MRQVKEQINYFRFLFKLTKKIHIYIMSQSLTFTHLKEHLLWSAYAKMHEIEELRHVRGVNLPQVKKFTSEKEFDNIRAILHMYRERYSKTEIETRIVPRSHGDIQFVDLLTTALKILFKNIVKIESNFSEFEKKRILVIIFEELMELSRLYQLNLEDDWDAFVQKTSLDTLIEREACRVERADWVRIKEKFLNGKIDG